MVGFSKKRKSSKLRGSREHGRGRKKGRGAGLRGGKGMAGSHKHRLVQSMKAGHVWGKHGFKMPEEAVNVVATANVRDLDASIDAWVAAGSASKSGDAFEVDLTALGVDKLLGGGQVRAAYTVKVAEATASAVSKVEDAGGKVELPSE
jgi:large subunit ribosomal protein L15